ncbi:MAG: hypothetical protein RMJ98_05165 [Myxococcales bacterium]|nr:hypothetical protein [Polyangiaceae bacterium]MDW8248679.1 hypothetical protein [Myxococcales bacterium]
MYHTKAGYSTFSAGEQQPGIPFTTGACTSTNTACTATFGPPRALYTQY